MLQAAAERGVQVRIIVFKEVEQALTCELSKPPQMTRASTADMHPSELCGTTILSH